MKQKKKIDVTWNPEDKKKISAHARARGWSFGMFVSHVLELHVNKKRTS